MYNSHKRSKINSQIIQESKSNPVCINTRCLFSPNVSKEDVEKCESNGIKTTLKQGCKIGEHIID